MIKFSDNIKTIINGDEYYTPQNVVDMILPYVTQAGYTNVWCPFDRAESNFVKTFKNNGLLGSYGHIDTGQDFFEYEKPQGDIIISNPPFSKRNQIFKKLYDWDIPFAIIMHFNGLFDNKKRLELFSSHNVEMLVPKGRMKFIHKERGLLNTPNFQSIYVCNKLLGKQIVFDETSF